MMKFFKFQTSLPTTCMSGVSLFEIRNKNYNYLKFLTIKY